MPRRQILSSEEKERLLVVPDDDGVVSENGKNRTLSLR